MAHIFVFRMMKRCYTFRELQNPVSDSKGGFFYFGRISGARQPPVATRRKPGYPLVSFLPAAKKDTASIPCANQNRSAVLILWSFTS
jgi:hypothetical protein